MADEVPVTERRRVVIEYEIKMPPASDIDNRPAQQLDLNALRAFILQTVGQAGASRTPL